MCAGEYADDRLQPRLEQVRATCDALLAERARRLEPVYSSAIATQRLAPECPDELDVTWHNGAHRELAASGGARGDGPGLLGGAALPNGSITQFADRSQVE